MHAPLFRHLCCLLPLSHPSHSELSRHDIINYADTVYVRTVIWFYFVLYLISYAAARTKIKRTNIFNNEIFAHVSYTIWGAYEIKTARNNNL